MRLPTVFLLVVSCALGFEQESCYLSEEEEDQCASVCYPIVKPLLRYFEVCQTKDRTNAELQEKYSKIEEKYVTLVENYSKIKDELNKVSLENKDLQAKKDLEFEKQKVQIEQQSTRIIQLQDEISDLKKSCELSVLKNLFSEELEKLQKITKSGQEVIIEKENNDSKVNSVTKIEATNTTTSPSNSEKPIEILPDRCPETQDDMFSYPEIQIPGLEPFQVRCYSDEKIGSGWMEVYWKHENSEDFNRTYEEYINGFGKLWRQKFMGLEKLHILTNWKPHEVRIGYLVQCKTFVVGDKSEGYMLKKIDGCIRNTEKFDLIQGTKFSTKDRDEDGNPNHHWAKEVGFGWWVSSGLDYNVKGEAILMQIRRKD
ncbi:protein scabrous-like [Drosophila bipectinata]|uniref:protein scabrous-like n=1 Tax=Drosophila bipectinata TaxID=42026 RepID=UPI001C89D78F|nr:protein scabrous-like [Drosophila bipectinata]